MKTTFIKIISCLMLFTTALHAQNIIELQGEWSVQLDKNETGLTKTKGLKINLPGTLAEAAYGEETVGSDFGILTPTHKYIGVAWYERTIEIPKKWKHKNIDIFLERVLWESQIFIDGDKLSTKDALGTPHIHNIGKLKPGKHKLSIRVNNDMIHNIGDKGHAYGEYTQSIWNGIVGRMEMQAKDPTFISSVRTFPMLDNDQLKVELEIESASDIKSEITIEISELGKEISLHKISVKHKLSKGKHKKEIILDLNRVLKKWTEFDPTVYMLTSSVETRKSEDQKRTEFGYLEISHDGTNITINNQPIFLRGNLDCVHFPLTGYPSMKVEDWSRIFRIYKDYGLNHVRFHSWCPPEAAFKAANRVGIYIQAEASIWIDWWMSEDMIVKGRPEMDTKGHPKGLGKDPKRDAFVTAEMNRVVDFYGNNPSFTMFCIGNELGNADFDVMEQWIADLKKKDPRRLYATSTARKIMDVDDYMATHYIPDVGRTRGLNGAGTDWDFEAVYSQMDIPIIAHEIGQWPVYPSWDEIDKYTGALKARNFEEFREMAIKNGVEDQDEDFRRASGALNQIMYKYETESFLRTASCAGVQLLSMQDYQGQGEALIGWLDAHWDSKGITTPQKFKEHFDETVPLLRTQKFIWTNNEIFKAKVQLSHYGKSEIKSGEIIMKILNQEGKVLKEEIWPVKNILVGQLVDVGNIMMDLKELDSAQQLTVLIQLKDTHFKNDWKIWVYPEELPLGSNETILVTDEMNDETISALNNGGKVLLLAHNLGAEENSISVDFYPLYWSLTFFPGQGKTSIGLLLKDEHAVFKNFPTSFHSDWQWETFKKSTKGFILNDLPVKYKPIAQVVDDFHRNNKEGAIFEFKVGKGKLLVCGFDISNADNPVARQLKYSLTEYMQGIDFNPDQAVDEKYLNDLFPIIPRAERVDTDGEFENILIHVDAGKLMTDKEVSTPWTKNLDAVISANEGSKYKVKAEGVWLDDHVSAWHGPKMAVEVNCPNGILGTFYVQFNDWNNKGREGYLEFEGRKVKLDKHGGKDGKWVKFHVMREDSNDGKLVFKAKMEHGGNLMISQIVLVKD